MMIYIAIEGLDGSGKSTLFQNIVSKLEEEKISFSECKPTKPLNPDGWLEQIFKRSLFLRNRWLTKAFLYSRRSREAAEKTNWNSPLVLGDRSVITSYVVYRHRFNSKLLAQKWVDTLEPDIPSPDIVLYLRLPIDELNDRKLKRGKPLDQDEVGRRPGQMFEAYEEIRNGSWSISRLSRLRWIDIDASGTIETVKDCAWKEIKRITSQKEY